MNAEIKDDEGFLELLLVLLQLEKCQFSAIAVILINSLI